jgi:hypothetical protein
LLTPILGQKRKCCAVPRKSIIMEGVMMLFLALAKAGTGIGAGAPKRLKKVAVLPTKGHGNRAKKKEPGMRHSLFTVSFVILPPCTTVSFVIVYRN